MTLRITIDIFSGRPNPMIQISGRAATSFLKRVKPAAKGTRNQMPSPDWRLGYRGLIVEQHRVLTRSLPRVFRIAAGALYSPDFAGTIADPALETELFGPRGIGSGLKLKGVTDPPTLLRKAVRDLWAFRDGYERHKFERAHHRHHSKCACAPHYEPSWWNDGGQKQLHNNCYNYACNYRTD